MSELTPLFGISEVDDAILPVLPVGWLGLIEGAPGTGTHLLAKQAAHSAAGAMPVFYYATHEPAGEVERVFDEFGWGTEGMRVADLDAELFSRLRGREIAVYRARARGLKLAEVTGGSGAMPPMPPAGLTGRLLADIAPLDAPFRFVLDSFDLLLELTPGEEATTVARQIRHQAYTVGGGALFVVHPGVSEPRTLALLEVIADFIVRLDHIETGERFQSRLTVTKVRNHPERGGAVRVEVTEHGFEARAPALS